MPFGARNVNDEQLLWKKHELMQHQNVHRSQVLFHQDDLGKDVDNVVDDDEVVVQELVLVLM